MMYKLRKNNKGAALMLVLVAVALVTVLVTTMLTASLINIQMKASERKGIENFYSADTYMDLVKSVVKTDADKVLDSAYKKLLVGYTGSANEEQNFYMNFASEFEKIVKGSSATKAEALERYADRILSYDGGDLNSLNAKFVGGIVDGSGNLIDAEDWDGGDLKKRLKISIDDIVAEKNGADYTGAIWLKGVMVTYTDEYDYQTTVKTDMKIYAEYPNPDIIFDKIDPSEYIAITDGEFTNGTASGKVEMTGNVCAIKGITVNNLFETTFKAKRLITNGAFGIKEGGKAIVNTEYDDGVLTDSGKDDAVWAKDISINVGKYEGTGNVYLSDDLEFSHTTKSANISEAVFKSASGESNEFVGFGAGKVASKALNNSAILFNTSKFKLDMIGLSNLTLTGNAFISVPLYGGGSNEIVEGESISYKGLQQLYLVPRELLGPSIKTNPCLASELPGSLDELGELNTYFKDTVKIENGVTDSGINLTGFLDATVPVKVNIVTGASGINQVYFFYNFKSVEMAQKYMTYVYTYTPATIDKALNKLELTTKYILPNSTSIFSNYINNLGEMQFAYKPDVKKESTNYNIKFSKLLGTLDPLGVGGVNLLDPITIYNRLVYASNISNVSSKAGTIYTNPTSSSFFKKYLIKFYHVTGTGTSDILTGMAEVGKGASNATSVPGIIFADGDISIPGNFYGLIVANGKVRLGGKLRGLVIAKGDVTYTSGQDCTYDKELIKLMLRDNSIGSLVGDYLKCYTGSTNSSSGTAYTQAVKITYDNWQENPD